MSRARLFLPGLLLVAGLLLWQVAPEAERLEAWIAELGSGADSGRGFLWTCGALAAATLVSEDLTCLAAGGLVAQGALSFWPAAGACFLGIFVGDMLLFLSGRWLGSGLLARAPCRWFLDPERVAEAAGWLERRGPLVILASRFLPGARLPTYFASGALGLGLARFTGWFALAGLCWTPLVVGLAAGLGQGLARLGLVGGSAAWLLAGTLAAGGGLLAFAKALATWRGRALLRARLRRWTRFEYWPVGVFYLPVFALFLARSLRGQGLVFTAANPALPHGGFVGESKRAIYALLAAARAPLPRMLCLERAELGLRRETVRAFLLAAGPEFPLVVKPDAGQRGEGVRIVRDGNALDAALAASDEALVLQEFVPGEEYGLFYARASAAAPGRILSITHKVLPAVTGDGTRALEALILSDREHLPMAPLFLARAPAELARVPAAGERVPLGELGTHCRGARFLDGNALASAPLAGELERIVRAMPGFHFGRFDVRATSAAELQRGHFTILELNGVTSEAAHIYDPRWGLRAAWRALLEQWRLAYAIGASNALAGARVSTLGELWTAVRAYQELTARRGRRASSQPRPAPQAWVGARP